MPFRYRHNKFHKDPSAIGHDAKRGIRQIRLGVRKGFGIYFLLLSLSIESPFIGKLLRKD